jgi:predicted phosphodiesterase
MVSILPSAPYGTMTVVTTESRRLAALYDVHGNLPALEAVLAEVERERCDLIVFGGDVAAGPHSAETVEVLVELGDRARFVLGNCEQYMIRIWDGEVDEDRDTLAFDWAAKRLTKAQRDFLDSFPEVQRVDVPGLGTVLFRHGSPRSIDEVVTPLTPEPLVAEMVAGVPEPVAVIGHTHIQFDRRVAGHRVVNAGSVGMPYADRPGAYWALLADGEVSLRRTDYDLDAASARIVDTGWPVAQAFVDGNLRRVPTASKAAELHERRAGRS